MDLGAEMMQWNAKRGKFITPHHPDWVDKVHYDNNGKRMCSIAVTLPLYSSKVEEVTCTRCLLKLKKVGKKNENPTT